MTTPTATTTGTRKRKCHLEGKATTRLSLKRNIKLSIILMSLLVCKEIIWSNKLVSYLLLLLLFCNCVIYCPQNPGTASFGMSVFNLGNAIMGSGILGLSYAMANTGIALFVILLIAVAIFSLYSVHLLLKTANEGGALVYEQLGYKAFGMPGKLAASCSITMQNIGAMSSYLYIVKYELPIVIQAFTGTTDEWYVNGDYLVLLVSVTIILPLSLLKNLGYLGYTSGLSLLCMVFFLIVVSLFPQQTKIKSEAVTECAFLFLFPQTVYAVPFLTFAFVCHPAILPMYEELKDRSRRKMQSVANVSFLAMFIMYLLAALFGYLTFNIHVEPELLHTYSKIDHNDVILLIVRLAVLTAVTLTVPVVLFPIRTSVNQLMCASKEFSWVRHTLITVVLLAGTNALVIFVPTIRDIFGFIGASAAGMLIFILPSAFYIKLVKKESMKSVQKIGVRELDTPGGRLCTFYNICKRPPDYHFKYGHLD
uniref:Sodium-coupled neutral amino acid symporter 2 n=1 Tax=Neogobius melanostomus TaxID=47308 RepID=A0A8C6WV17_9GOBI